MYYKRRKLSLHYRLEKWFFSNHEKEIKTAISIVGEIIAAIGMFAALFLLPAFFH